ncbi:DNA polymerase IV, partial [Escherichia coli]|nr:DNA polymerase IV [Escherichia coli]
DLACFFAPVALRDNPALRDFPIAIGPSRERRRVITTANYPTRKIRVRRAMPSCLALQCFAHPALLPGPFHAYQPPSTHLPHIF